MAHPPKVTLETLLRLKRAERPSAEFWSRFERELHEKQLAALVARNPWWRELPHLLARRAYLPIGATAAIAFTLVSVKYYAPAPVAQAGDQAVSAPVAEISAPSVPRNEVAAVPTTALASEVQSSVVDDRTAVAAAQPLSESIPAHSSELLPWSAPRQSQDVAARLMAGNNPAAAQSAFELDASGINQPLPATQRAIGAIAPTVEFAAVTALASRRTRLMAEMSERHFTPEPQAPEIVRERLSRRLADRDFNDRISRIGLQADRVLVKF